VTRSTQSNPGSRSSSPARYPDVTTVGDRRARDVGDDDIRAWEVDHQRIAVEHLDVDGVRLGVRAGGADGLVVLIDRDDRPEAELRRSNCENT
jgi:hypothetical protein